MNPFDKLKATCKKVCHTRPVGAEAHAVKTLLGAIADYKASGEDKETLLFTTDPHGEQTLALLGDEAPETTKIGNLLFTLSGTDRAQITMTGEELDSLCQQWQEYRNHNTQELN